MLRSPSAKVLDDRDLVAARAVLDRDPVANCFVASRVEACGLEPWRLGAEVWGHYVDGRLDALCYSGANLVPVNAQLVAARAFADKARRQGRRCSSIVGPADAIEAMWHLLLPSWGPARDIRLDQPLMMIDVGPQVAPDRGVRRVLPHELDLLLPACVAMFTEELGISPLVGDGGALYRQRVAELIESGRALARIEDGRVVFKAEIGAATKDVCQVQGVWVDPVLRGRGLAKAGIAAVVVEAQRSVAPVVSLYVNEYNVSARRVYEQVGFIRCGTFASILF